MSEMREYQQKMLNSKSEIVFCNWDRAKGKTTCIISKILNKRGNFLYISNSSTHFRKEIDNIAKKSQRIDVSLGNEIYEEGLYSIFERANHYTQNENRTYIEFNNGYMKSEIDIIYSNENDLDNIRGRKFDYVFFDEIIPNSKTIEIVKQMGVKQIFVMTTLFEGNNKVEFITDYEKEMNEKDFYNKQIKELMIEFQKIPKNEKTTITREKVLGMIDKLKELKHK